VTLPEMNVQATPSTSPMATRRPAWAMTPTSARSKLLAPPRSRPSPFRTPLGHPQPHQHPIVKIGGANAADFSVSAQPGGSTIAAAGSDTFDITFNPSAAGVRTAIITIANNDSNENPYNFTIRGTGTTTPEIQLTRTMARPTLPSAAAAAGDRDFGNAEVNAASVVRTFIIKNVGSSTLGLSGTPRVSSDDPQFAVTQQPSAAPSPQAASSHSKSPSPDRVGRASGDPHHHQR